MIDFDRMFKVISEFFQPLISSLSLKKRDDDGNDIGDDYDDDVDNDNDEDNVDDY